MKKKFTIFYIISGCIWCICNLPNIIVRTNNDAIKGWLLSLFRIVAWPVLFPKYCITKIKENKKQKKSNTDSETDSENN